MKSIKRYVLPFLFLALVGYVTSKMVRGINLKQSAAIQTINLPDFSFRSLDSSTYSAAMLPEKRPVVFLYFNTECDHCRYEAEEIVKNPACFKGSSLLMVSTERLAVLRAFNQEFGLSRFPEIRVLQDDRDIFRTLFANQVIPAVFIYNKDRRLVQQFKGEVKLEAICKYL